MDGGAGGALAVIVVDFAREAVEAGIQRARAWARRWAIEQLQSLPAISDLRRLATELHTNELTLEELRANLVRLRDQGLARPSDFATYDVARENMYATHLRFHRLLQRIFAAAPEVLGQLPAPKMAPKVDRTPQRQTLSRALGQAEAAAPAAALPAAAAAPAWMLAAVVLIILATITLAITVVVAGAMLEEVIRDVLVTRQQLQATKDAYEARQSIYDDCVGRGMTPEQCGAVAEQTVPMPPMVLDQTPRPGAWVKWLTIGLITVTVAGFGIWGISKLRGGRRTKRPKLEAPRYRRLSPGEFLESDGGDYHMEDV